MDIASGDLHAGLRDPDEAAEQPRSGSATTTKQDKQVQNPGNTDHLINGHYQYHTPTTGPRLHGRSGSPLRLE